METNKTQQMTWVVVIIIVIIGLVLIYSKKNGETTITPDTLGNESAVSTSTSTTGEVKTSTVVTPRTTTAGTKTAGNVVQLTAGGFSPFILEIKRGESVEFLNSSDKAMVIRSFDDKPESTYRGFSQTSAPLGKGGKFYFNFSVPGAWGYYNLNSPRDQGVIIVK